MAISWGAWEYSGGNGMRVGIEVEWEAVGHAEAEVTATVRIYTENQFAYSDSQTLNYGGAIGGSTNFTNSSGGAQVLRATKTYDYTYGANSYGSSPGDRTFTATLSGAFNGVTPSKSVTSAIPARPIAAPAAPTAAAVSRISDASTKLSWTRHSTSGEPYQSQTVQRTVDDTGTYATVANLSGTATSYTNATAANHKYRYKVRAENSAGESAYDFSTTIFTTPATPGAPSRAEFAGPLQRITWTNPGMNYSEYVTEIIGYKNGASQGVVGTVATGVTTFDHTTSSSPTPYTAGDSWKYTVRHKTSTGDELWSPETAFTSETAGATSPPDAPTNLSPNGVTIDPTIVNALTWTHNPTDTTDQIQLQVRHRLIGAGSWTTEAAQLSSAKTWNLPANTYVVGDQFEWQVATRGSDLGWSPWSASAVVTAFVTKLVVPRWNVGLGDFEVDMTGFDWKAPTLLNSWVNFGSTWENAGYCRRGGMTCLRGLIKNGTITAGTDLFILPVGYRPSTDKHIVTASNNAVCVIQILANGTVQIGAGASATWISLAIPPFPAEL